MSKDIIVLTPNGRRQKVHCTPDTSILQVLEDVCLKQGFQPSDYDLKHHNHRLDLTTTVRFSNLPNKATLEMVEAERKRQESETVTIGLMLEDGERRTADFPPYTSLYDLITALAANELHTLPQPAILYMRQEVTGIDALKEKTLRQLGLIKGRAILRLLNKAEESRQANVSAVYRRPITDTKPDNTSSNNKTIEQSSNIEPTAGPSKVKFDPIKMIKDEKTSKIEEKKVIEEDISEAQVTENVPTNIEAMDIDKEVSSMEVKSTSSNTSMTQENLERRLKIEEEVTFIGAQKAIAYMQPTEAEADLEDLPDEFYELSIEEVRKLYHDLQQHRVNLENTPLLTSNKKQEIVKDTLDQKISVYKNVVVRIQFPDSIILQGIFLPTNTIEDVTNFIKEHIQNPEKTFHIFTTPLKETLDPKLTLLEAKFVPCVHMHFKWYEDDGNKQYLKQEIYSMKTTSDAASILASKYRAPSRRKMDDGSDNSQRSKPSTSKNSKVPKWFKN